LLTEKVKRYGWKTVSLGRKILKLITHSVVRAVANDTIVVERNRLSPEPKRRVREWHHTSHPERGRRHSATG